MSKRIVNGAHCTWWDSIAKASQNAHGLPCCPHCGSVLFEVPNEVTWWATVDAHERTTQPGYRAQLEWMRGKCFPDFTTASEAYSASRVEG